MFYPPYVNRTICDSIPISKDLKRYLVNRFRRLVECNGRKYASDVFKTIREVCLRYRADPHRLETCEEYVASIPISRKGWVRLILHYMDCQPMFMLDFLKLYCGMLDPAITVEESATVQQEYLEERSTRVNTRVPTVLLYWLRFVLGKPLIYMSDHQIEEAFVGNPLICRFYKKQGAENLDDYQRKWRRILLYSHRISDDEAMMACDNLIPKPEMYSDYKDGMSKSMEVDYWAYCHLREHRGSNTLDDYSVLFLDGLLSQHPRAFSLWDETRTRGSVWRPNPMPIGHIEECVGQVHYIPKKGTVKRRPIAVPNRFIQLGLKPFQMQLEAIVKRLPQDCTFDQGRFDVKISNRVSNPNLYVSSVDLSQATDNLPQTWGWAIWHSIKQTHETINKPFRETVLASANVFRNACDGPWLNGYDKVWWEVGQPLGTLPSFDFLALTHNCLLEALSFSLGLRHSPYCVLGDDVLIFNRKLRNEYIKLLQSVGIPLSLHKSYTGNLVEFAGKIYIRNQVPAYSSDQNPITYNGLYDYQRSTGVSIPWNNLPKGIKKRISQYVSTCGLAASDGKRVYDLAVTNLVKSLSNPNILLQDMDVNSAFWTELLEDSDEPIPEPFLSSGVVAISGHPVTFGDYGYAEKHGHLQRFRKIALPDWYREKVRPYTTEKILSCASTALTGKIDTKE